MNFECNGIFSSFFAGDMGPGFGTAWVPKHVSVLIIKDGEGKRYKKNKEKQERNKATKKYIKT